MNHITLLTLIGLGGGIGAILRYLVSSATQTLAGPGFPYGTLAVNILGSFLIGVVAGLSVKFLPIDHWVRPFLVIGILGGFTTFSAFSLDLFHLIERQDYGMAFIYALISVTAGLISLMIGLMIIRAVAHGG